MDFDKQECRVIRARAKDLKSEGFGYIKTVRKIAEELWKVSHGGDAPIGSYAAINWGSALEEVLTFLGKLLMWWERRESEIQQIQTAIKPIVCAVFEEEPPRA